VDHWSNLLRAAGTLLWPLTVIILLILFRSQLRDSFGRLRKAKILGQEIELDASLHELERSVERIEIQPSPSNSDNGFYGAPDSERLRGIVGEASRSPKVALILLGIEIETEARSLLAGIGGSPGESPIQLRRSAAILILELSRRRDLPPGTLQAMTQFSDVRNQIVHGRDTASPDDVLRAIDSGLALLQAIHSVPKVSHRVIAANVPLYGNQSGTQPLHGVVGVRVLSEYGNDSDGTSGTSGISTLPTTKAGYYQVGKNVSWEWSSDTTWRSAWFYDEDGVTYRKAWDASMEFVGRHVDEI
jgi:hypothetical protein